MLIIYIYIYKMLYINNQREKQKKIMAKQQKRVEERARKKIKTCRPSLMVCNIRNRKINLIENYSDSHEWLAFKLQILWLPFVATRKKNNKTVVCNRNVSLSVLSNVSNPQSWDERTNIWTSIRRHTQPFLSVSIRGCNNNRFDLRKKCFFFSNIYNRLSWNCRYQWFVRGRSVI